MIIAIAIAASAALRTYEVKPGDTLWSIAARELGDGHRWSFIAAANGMTEPFRIEIGQKLVLPDTTSVDSAAATFSPAAADATRADSPSSPSTAPALAGRAAISGGVRDSNTATARPSDRASAPIQPAMPSKLSAVPSVTPLPDAAPTTAPSPETNSAPQLAPIELPRLATGARIPRPLVVSSDLVVQPLTLEDAVALGLKRAPEIFGAVASVRRARAEEGVAGSGALPQVTATGDARRNETFKSTSLLGVDEFTAGGTLTVTQALLSFGRLSSAMKAASAQEAAALASLAAAKSRVRFRVESAFLSLLLARIREDVSRDAVTAAAALERRARIREAEGVGTRFDISRALAERAAREARLAAASSGIEGAREELAVAMGLAPGTAIDVEGDLFVAPSPGTPENAVRIGMAERPDLAALEYSVRSGVALIDYERAQDRPSIGATASYSYTRHDYITSSSFFKGRDASSGFIGIGVTVPLFDGFRVRERVRSQSAAVDELKARQDRAKLDAEREIRGVYFDLDAAQKAVAARHAGVAAAQEALRMAQVSFEAGRATSLDVIEASSSLAEAAGAEAEAAFSYRLGIARLIAATGTDAVMEKR